MGKTYSPLRYPGGKGKFYKYILPIFQRNNLKNIIYIEPFAGGAGLACELLIKRQVNKVILNDYDRSIYAFWYSILNYTDEFCNKIIETEITLAERERQKVIQQNKDTASILELGFSTFYLNRTNRSGIIKGGPISQNETSGAYPLNCRFKKEKLIIAIKRIAELKDKIELYNYDAIEFLTVIKKQNVNNSFIFFDPPYYHNGKDLYVNFYTKDDHINLSNSIINMLKEYKWLITYDNCLEIRNIYNNIKTNGYKKIKTRVYSLSYTAGKARKASELIYYNNIIIPKSLFK
ncbi:TPA: DNA adenine methylase [Clostridium perfringens]|nr:DNA adenine methylase [Clostridium perfringens]